MYRRNVLNRYNLYLKKIASLPWGIIAIILTITLIGLCMMYSAAQGNMKPWAFRQIIHCSVFFPIMIIIAITDIKLWYKSAYGLYFCTLALLIFVELLGNTAKGATRWINLGFFKLQPSELMKISLIFPLARYFSSINYYNTLNLVYLLPPLLIILLPFLLILKQPDLGTATILLLLGGIIFFAAGVSIYVFIIAAIFVITLMPIGWHLLYDYQRARVLTFLNPEKDPLGRGYNIIQSKIAIGSGGLSGKGMLKGTQSQLDFLPEHQTDFIFTMFAEEYGFIGGVILLSLYTILLLYGISTAVNCKNHFGRIVAIGITSFIFLHVFINIAMVMGLLPAVGVPLPLMSYGGTIMMSVFIGLGLILNVHVHAKQR